MLFNSIIASVSAGLVGTSIGVLVSSSCKEEFKEIRNYVKIARNTSFLLALIVFFWSSSWLIPVVMVLFGISAIIYEKNTENFSVSQRMVLFYASMIILSLNTAKLNNITGLFFITFLCEGTLWCIQHEKLLQNGVFKKSVWKTLIKDEMLTYILPGISLLVLL